MRGVVRYVDRSVPVELIDAWKCSPRGFTAVRGPAALAGWIRAAGGGMQAAAALTAESEAAEEASIDVERILRGSAAVGWPDWPRMHAGLAAAAAAVAAPGRRWRLHAVGLRRSEADYDTTPHVDYSPQTLARYRAAVGKCDLVSVWVALSACEVPQMPLGLVDPASVRPEHAAAYSARAGDMTALRSSPLHRWYHLPGMEPGDAIVFDAGETPACCAAAAHAASCTTPPWPRSRATGSASAQM
eukprot:TRINITY_DN7884_c0_g1_i2.p1 TRINITY_DN7884_c0_g1~~TRINITY_DN7884_c0_g1_i2.p1  ORF type:complete len:244 (+),score=54.15 TRINITY_DN7884_c0_g1_i2:53-784(+)